MVREIGITWEADATRARLAGGGAVHVSCEATARIEEREGRVVSRELIDLDYWLDDGEGGRWHVSALEAPIYEAGYTHLDALLAGEADATRGAA